MHNPTNNCQLSYQQLLAARLTIVSRKENGSGLDNGLI